MKVVCAPDKLRGALSAAAAAAALAAGVREAGGEAVELPLGDGGEGTLDALVGAGVAAPVTVEVRDPLLRPVTAALGDLGGGSFLVEAAEAIGHARLRPGERDPRQTSSAGAGDLIRAALDRGAQRVLVAVGGTVNVDGGLGLLGALGAGVPGLRGEALLAEPAVDRSTVDERLAGVELVVLHDVDVPLTGPDGAARLFGPQKGLRADDVLRFDAALARLGEHLGGGVAGRPGAGAAGGLGVALYALGARGEPGATAVLGLVGFAAALAGAGLCLTAEGAVDRQSARGKTVAAVVAAAVAAGVPAAVIGGRVDDDGREALLALGARDVVALGPRERPLAAALAAAPAELRAAARALSAPSSSPA